MKRVNENFAKPYVLRDFEFVRAGPNGAYWQSADGMHVRVAAPEDARKQIREAPWRTSSQWEREVALGRSGAT
jgi:hypothetical protein